MKDNERLKFLNDLDWDVIIPEWITIARNICYRFGITNETIVNGKSLKDMVFGIIKKLYSKERNWEPDKVLLKAWFIKTLESEIRNLNKNHAVTKEDLIIDQDDYTLQTHIFKTSKSHNYQKTPEEYVITQEEEDELNAFINEFAGEDELILNMLITLLEDPDIKPKELSKLMSIPESEIYKTNRKIKRRLSKKLQEMRNDGK